MAPIFDMDEKLRQFLEGTASQEVKEEVREWAASDPDHQAQLEKLEALWGRAPGSAMYREIDSQADWQKVRQRLHASEAAPSGGTSTSSPARRYRFWAIAATILLLATLSIFLTRLTVDPEMLLAESFATAEEVALPDGSQVTLRPYSRLKYPEKFAADQRQLELEAGEAFFEVERNPEKPFIITAGASRVEVKGTSFTVERDGEHTAVAVKTGKVRFYIPDQQNADVLLTPGQKATLSPSIAEVATQIADENEFSWVSGKLHFDQTPIKEVLDDLAEHFRVSISSGSQLDSSKTLTTEFIDQNLEEVLGEIQVVLGIRYRIENDKVFVE